MAKGDLKKQRNRERQNRLLRMFEENSGYDVFNAGSVVFVKQWNGNTERWQVAIFTPESYANYESNKSKPNLTLIR